MLSSCPSPHLFFDLFLDPQIFTFLWTFNELPRYTFHIFHIRYRKNLHSICSLYLQFQMYWWQVQIFHGGFWIPTKFQSDITFPWATFIFPWQVFVWFCFTGISIHTSWTETSWGLALLTAFYTQCWQVFSPLFLSSNSKPCSSCIISHLKMPDGTENFKK